MWTRKSFVVEFRRVMNYGSSDDGLAKMKLEDQFMVLFSRMFFFFFRWPGFAYFTRRTFS